MTHRIQLFLALCLAIYPMSQAIACSENAAINQVSPNVCKSGLNIGPGGNFGVFVFCDDAAGTTIGVIAIAPNRGKNAAVMSQAWPLENRFWQDANWARDVMSFQWNKDGTKLRVSTNYIYGTNKLYTLDLVKKKILSAVEQPIKE